MVVGCALNSVLPAPMLPRQRMFCPLPCRTGSPTTLAPAAPHRRRARASSSRRQRSVRCRPPATGRPALRWCCPAWWRWRRWASWATTSCCSAACVAGRPWRTARRRARRGSWRACSSAARTAGEMGATRDSGRPGLRCRPRSASPVGCCASHVHQCRLLVHLAGSVSLPVKQHLPAWTGRPLVYLQSTSLVQQDGGDKLALRTADSGANRTCCMRQRVGASAVPCCGGIVLFCSGPPDNELKGCRSYPQAFSSTTCVCQ